MHPADFSWRPAPDPAVSPENALLIRWLGTAGYELTCAGTTLLIDPYLTRVSWQRFLFGRIAPDESRVRAAVHRADAIVVGHSHFDHVMDVPLIAKLTGAKVYGSSSAANLMRASGLPEPQIAECRGGEVFEAGPFRVELVPSAHSRFWMGRVPYAGEIPSTCEIPMRGRDYKCGQVFNVAISVGGLRLYHVGSCNLIDDAVPAGDVDIALLCIIARQAEERFLPRILGKLGPRWIVPSHYDNFFRPLDRPLQLLPRVAFGRFVDDVAAVSRDMQVATLDLNGSVRLPVRL